MLVRRHPTAGPPPAPAPSALTLLRFDAASSTWPLPRPLPARASDVWMWLAGDAVEVVLRTEAGTEHWRWRKGQAMAEQLPELELPEAEVFFAGPRQGGGFVTASRTPAEEAATWLHQPAPWRATAIGVHDADGRLLGSAPLQGCGQLDGAVTAAAARADGSWVVSYRLNTAADVRLASSAEPAKVRVAMAGGLDVDPSGRFAAMRPHPKDQERCIVRLENPAMAWQAGEDAVAREVGNLVRSAPVEGLRARDEALYGTRPVEVPEQPQFDLGALYVRPLRGAKVAEAKVSQAVVDAYQAAGLKPAKLASIPGFQGQQVRATRNALGQDCVLVHAAHPGWCGVFSWQLELSDPREHALALALSKGFEVLGMRSEAGKHVTWTRYRNGKAHQATSVGPAPLATAKAAPLDLDWLVKHLRAPAGRPAPTAAEVERVLMAPGVLIEQGGISTILGFADAIESDGALADDAHLLVFG